MGTKHSDICTYRAILIQTTPHVSYLLFIPLNLAPHMTLTPHLTFSSCFPFIPRTVPLHPLPRLHLTSLFLQASPHPLHPTCPSPMSPPYLTLTSRTAYTRLTDAPHTCEVVFSRYVTSQTPSHLSLSISLDPDIPPSYQPSLPCTSALTQTLSPSSPAPQLSHRRCLCHGLCLSPHRDLVYLMACASVLTQT